MPYKGSRATHKKNGMLDQLQKHKKWSVKWKLN